MISTTFSEDRRLRDFPTIKKHLIGGGFFWAITENKRMIIVGALSRFVLGVAIAVPAVQESISQRVIYKGNEAAGVFFSRELVWQESYENALEGGLFGVGYGATAAL